MLPQFSIALTKFVEAMPDAHTRYGVAFCNDKILSHLLPVEGIEQMQAGERAYTCMRRASDFFGIPISLSDKFPYKSDYGSTDKKGRVKLRRTLPPPHMAHVGVHEMAHSYFQFDPAHPANQRTNYQANQDEYEAELTAYLFSDYFGVTCVDSPLYIASYRGKIRDITRVGNRAAAYAWTFISAGENICQTKEVPEASQGIE